MVLVFLVLLHLLPGLPAGPGDTLVFTYTTDRGVDAEIFLAHADDRLPERYYCDLKTPICIDNLCNPIEIRLVWDLLGNFHSYEEVKGKEITKFDHEPFEAKDHEQLKAILADRESLLQDYRIEDLVDTTVKVYSSEIDGLTAATSTTFADKLVPGAIYTCYTLWHLVNGEIAGRIRRHTKGLLNTALRRKMLLSGITAYEDYILDGIAPAESLLFAPDLFRLVAGRNRFIAIKSVRKLPPPVQVKALSLEMIGKFHSYEFPVQSAVIRYFTAQPCDAELMAAWAARIPELRPAHKTAAYALIETHIRCLSSDSRQKLLAFLERKEEKADGEDKKLMTLLNKN